VEFFIQMQFSIKLRVLRKSVNSHELANNLKPQITKRKTKKLNKPMIFCLTQIFTIIEPMFENKWKRNCVVKKKFYTKLLVYKILHFDEFEFEFEFDLSNIPVLNALSKTCLTPSFESAEHSEILKKIKKITNIMFCSNIFCIRFSFLNGNWFLSFCL
jgi:hypothetical protein